MAKTCCRMVLAAGGLLAAMSLAATAAAQAPTNPLDPAADRQLRAAAGFLHRGMHDLAAEEYTRFLSAHADAAEASTARYGLAVSLMALGRHRDAAVELDLVLAVKQFEFAPDALLLRARCAIAAKDHAGAAAWLKRIREQHPAFANGDAAAVMEGECLYRAGRAEDAMAVFDIVAAAGPNGGSRDRAELIWSLSAISLGRDREAAERLARLRQRPASEPASESRMLAGLAEAQCRQRLGQTDAARTLFDQAAKEGDEATASSALLGLAQTSRSAGDAAAALKALDRLPALRQAEPAARFERGLALLDLGNFKKALEQFEGLLKATPGDGLADDAAYWSARCELGMGEPARSAERLAAAVRAHPNSELIPWMLVDRGNALARANQDAEALGAFDSAARNYSTSPVAPDALAGSASAALRLGRHAESTGAASDFLRKFAAHDRANEVRLILAESKYGSQDFEGAEKAFAAYLTATPAPAPASARHASIKRGLALARLARMEEALRLLAEAVEESTDDDDHSRAALAVLGDEAMKRSDWQAAQRWFGRIAADKGAARELRDDATLKLGLSLERDGKPGDALAQFDQLIASQPTGRHAPQAHFERGQVLLALGRSAEATVAFNDVVRLEAGDDQPLFTKHALRHLAAIAAAAGDAGASADLLARLSELPGGDTGDTAVDRGAALLGAGRYEEALSVLGPYIEQASAQPRLAEARARRALALSRLERRQEALAEFDRLTGQTLEPSLGEVVALERGACLRALNQPEKAWAVWQELVKADASPRTTAHAHAALAQADAEAGRFSEALDHVKACEAAAAKSDGATKAAIGVRAAYLRGMCELRLGNAPAAVAALAPLKDLTGPETEGLALHARLLLGEALLQSGNAWDAAAELAFVADHSEDPAIIEPALLRLGESHAATHDWTASEAAFERHLTDFPESERWYQSRFGIGWARENDGRKPPAIESYLLVAAKHEGPTAARAQFQIGECLFSLKKHDEAVRELVKVDVLYAYPEWSAAALYEAGRCLDELGRPEKAIEQFRQVVDRFGTTDWAQMAREQIERIGRASAHPAAARKGEAPAPAPVAPRRTP